MKAYLTLSITDALSIELGRYGFHGHAFGRGLHVCAESRLDGERWAWMTRDAGVTTGRFGPFTFTAGRR